MRSLTNCRDSYIKKICKRFEELLFQREIHTLLPAGTLLPNKGQVSIGQILEMQQKVGSIDFAVVISRPDIALAASILTRALAEPFDMAFRRSKPNVRNLPEDRHLRIVRDQAAYVNSAQGTALRKMQALA